VARALAELHRVSPIARVIAAGGRAFEGRAEARAGQNGVDVRWYFPDWRKHGRFAGLKAGRRMLRATFDPKLVLAFLSERPSRSTLNLIGQARRAGIEVVVKGGPAEAGRGRQALAQPGGA
jgi:hypothetical protein